MNDALKIGGKEIKSRLFLGTGKFPYGVIPEVINRSGAEVVTVALRRADFSGGQEDILSYVHKDCILMPNTSGARDAAEAVKIARLARAAGCGDWIKIEVIKDNKYLLPDNYETIKATEILAKELQAVGAAAVMPLGAPIGTNRGLKTKELVRILIDEVDLPIIVDAGIGKPSEAAEAMEMGAAAVLVNTAIATAENPAEMAEAFGLAVQAGRKAYLAGPGATKIYAEASSPLTGFLHG